MLEAQDALGVARQDRWDSFYLSTPNFSFMLPGLTYEGPEPDAVLPRDAVIDLFRDYAQRIAASVQLGTEATRIAKAGAGLHHDAGIPRFHEGVLRDSGRGAGARGAGIGGSGKVSTNV